MNTRVVLVLALLLSVTVVSAASSHPSLMGPSGLAIHPTADVPQEGAVDLAIAFQDTDDFFGDIWLSRAVFGADKNLELALVYGDVQGENEFEAGRIWEIGVKYVVLDRPEQGLKVAAGTGYGRFKNSWELKGLVGYAVASRDFRRPGAVDLDGRDGDVGVRGHLGLVYGEIKEREAGSGFDSHLLQPWVGLELLFPCGTSVALDYRPHDEDIQEEKDIYGIVVRHPVTEALTVEVGTVNAFSNPEKQRMFYGLSYQITGAKADNASGSPW